MRATSLLPTGLRSRVPPIPRTPAERRGNARARPGPRAAAIRANRPAAATERPPAFVRCCGTNKGAPMIPDQHRHARTDASGHDRAVAAERRRRDRPVLPCAPGALDAARPQLHRPARAVRDHLHHGRREGGPDGRAPPAPRRAHRRHHFRRGAKLAPAEIPARRRHPVRARRRAHRVARRLREDLPRGHRRCVRGRRRGHRGPLHRDDPRPRPGPLDGGGPQAGQVIRRIWQAGFTSA